MIDVKLSTDKVFLLFCRANSKTAKGQRLLYNFFISFGKTFFVLILEKKQQNIT